MWLLDNTTPFSVERVWARTQNGEEVWIVAVKGSFLLGEDGQQLLDPKQSEVLRVPRFRGQPQTSSLLSEADLVQTKPKTDVLVEGYAMAPHGKAVRTVDVRLKVAAIDKTLRVHGDRVITRGIFGLILSDPQPFKEMPLVWEKSFGGTDLKDADPVQHEWQPQNPVGVGFATRDEHLFGTVAPNIEGLDSPYKGSKTGKPVGFGPIARHWEPRVRYAGTYDKQWEGKRRPLLPLDFDDRFYQCAPEDQQVEGHLKGGEVVELYNLTPDGYLTFLVPRVTLSMTTRFYDGTEVEHRPLLHTLILQPSIRRFELVWHSALPCHHRVNKLAITRVIVKRRINMSQRNVEPGIWYGG